MMGITLFVLYLGITYWGSFVKILLLVFHAGMPLLLGCLIAYIVNILMSFYEKHYPDKCRWKAVVSLKRILCMLLAFVSLAGIILLILNLILPELVNCVRTLWKAVPAALERLVKFLENNEELSGYMASFEKDIAIDQKEIIEKLSGAAQVVLGKFGGFLNSMVMALSSILSMVVTVFVGVVFSIYLLIGKEKLGGQIKLLIKTYLPKIYKKIMYVAGILNESFHNYIVGQCTEAVILGTLCILGMFIFRFPYAVMIGVFIGFTALIPVAGAYIGAAVGVVMIFTVSPIKAVLFIVFIVALQQLEGNLIYPRVVGKSIGLPGIWVLAAVTVGGGICGIAGMLFAVPLASAVYKLIREDVRARNL